MAATSRELRRICVDLTPVLPGGDNGGAKVAVLALLAELSKLAPETELILLTSYRSHDELASLDAPNMRRVCVVAPTPLAETRVVLVERLRRGLAAWLPRALPSGIVTRLHRLYWALTRRQTPVGLLRELRADLLFNPFTAPFYADPAVLTVSLVHDLQYRYYPQFFASEDRFAREQHFQEACRKADRLVCISEYVRQTVLENDDLPAERVSTIHWAPVQGPSSAEPGTGRAALDRLELSGRRFLLYPANAWPHKNHRALLTAFGMFQSRHPRSDLALVCTGAPDERMADLRNAAVRMGLGERIFFPGFVSNEEFAALLGACQALVFPSLFEGFGMPVLEAMAAGKPVLCSNVTSLPEVVGDAALLFDPRKPAEIAGAIERLESDPALASDLVQRGYERVRAFGDVRRLAHQYLELFRDVLRSPRALVDGVQGVYQDRWTGEHVVVTCGPAEAARSVEAVLAAPPWLPCSELTVEVRVDGSTLQVSRSIPRGKSETLCIAVPPQGGIVDLRIRPVFVPRALGLNDDTRALGCQCDSLRLVSEQAGTEDLLKVPVTEVVHG